MKEEDPFNSVVPAGMVWDVLKGELGNKFDLYSIAQYAVHVAKYEGQEAIEALGTQLYRLGLFPDPGLLEMSDNIGDRLAANIDIFDRVRNMYGTDERRLSTSIRQAGSDDERRERAERVRKIREIHRGNQDVIQELRYSDVEGLFRTSLGGGGGRIGRRRSPSNFSLESVLKDNIEQLAERAEEFREAFNKAINDGETSVSVSLNDDETLYDKDGIDDDFYMFISHFINKKTYGGVVYDATDLQEAIETFQALDSELFDIHSHGTRFNDLRRFAESHDEFASVTSAIDQYDEARSRLLESFDELYSEPLFFLLADPTLLEDANNYLEKYQEAENQIDNKYQTLKRQAGGGAQTLLSEFILLDTIAVRFDDAVENYNLLLSPIHPLHLWKFVTLARRILDERDSLDELDRDFLKTAVDHQPHVLRSLDVGNSEHLPSAHLVQDGEIGKLPIYVPAEKAAIGTNKSVWDHLLDKFLTAHPPSSRKLRISVIDPIRPGELLDELIEAADDGRVTGADVEFVYIENERDSILYGANDRDDVIDIFGPGGDTNHFSVNVADYNSYQDYLEYLDDNPRHLIVLNDHSSPTVREFERDKNVTVHPLYVPKIFSYNAFDDQIEMHSSSEGEMIFSKYQNLINNLNTQYNDVHNASVHRLKVEPAEIDEFCDVGVWVTVSTPSTNLDPFPHGSLIAREHRGERDYAIYSKDRDYFSRALQRLFNEYPMNIESDDIAFLVDDIVEYERSGLLRLITEETEGEDLSKNAKGIIGAILAVQWIEEEYDEPKLILSIDDPVTRKWLNLGEGNERADFIVVSFDKGEGIVIDILEVKAHDHPDSQFSIDKNTSPPTVSGPAIEGQLLPTTQTIRKIFTNEEDVTTGPRRAALREQIFYELMSSGVSEEKQAWVTRINNAFNEGIVPKVNPHIVSIEITNTGRSIEEFTGITESSSQKVVITRLPRPILYQLISGDLPEVSSVSDLEVSKQGSESEEEARSTDEGASDDVTSKAEEANMGDEEGLQTSEKMYGDPMDYADDVERLKRTLSDFGINHREINTNDVEVGPNIIRYKIKLAPNETQRSIESRTEDIARAMAMEREPIVHRVPGTEFVALDVPRSDKTVVPFEEYRDRLPSGVPLESLPFLAGVTPSGEVHLADLNDAPHMLVGGSTGSGKTVFLYSLISSILDQKSKDEIELALIDPKTTDFVYFNNLPNLVNEHVLTDAQETAKFFDSLVENEIPYRKKKLQDKIARDIGEFNELVDDPKMRMTPLVVVIDEYADLLQQLGEDADHTEDNVRTIAQVARSLGIHLVIATQRPSHNAIDTDLRANLDMRAAFRLPKKSDSRVVLDEAGAEELGGDGDMLLKEADRVTRLQGFFIDSSLIREMVQTYSE